MQLFSITALIISFNEHHSPLFPSAWFSLCICLCISSLNPLFPAHIISPFLSLSHTNSMAFTIPSLPISLYSPWFDAQLMPRSISALLKHPLGFHPTTHSLSHTHTHWAHMLRYCVIFCWFKLISGIIRRAHNLACVRVALWLLPRCHVKEKEKMILTFSWMSFVFFFSHSLRVFWHACLSPSPHSRKHVSFWIRGFNTNIISSLWL